MNLAFHVNDANAQKLISALGASGRAELFSGATESLAELCAEWIRKAAPSRHKTATRLGAAKTAHLGDASAITTSSDSSGGSVKIPIAGITRAFHPLDIYPKNKKVLTIPISAPAYGHNFKQLRDQGWTFYKTKKAPGILYGKGHDDKVYALFRLRTHSHVPQDSGLLPSDAEMSRECAEAISSLLNRRMANG